MSNILPAESSELAPEIPREATGPCSPPYQYGPALRLQSVVGGEAEQYRKSSVISRTRIHPPYLRTPNNFNPFASRIAFISKDN